MKPIKMWRFAGLFFLLFSLMISSVVAQQAAKRNITNIAGDLYRFQNNFHFSVFLVTPEGIIATDPLNADAAKWLKTELQKRFSKDVKYLIYSHDHADHIAGGEVFADTAIIIAHENAKKDIIGEKRPTAIPDLTFSDKMVIELGGKTVELSYLGPNHSDNSIVMRFPEADALFAVDFIPVQAMAFRNLADSYVDGWIDSLKRVEQMDFSILVPGHGRLGEKADVAAFRGYMEDLYDEVLSYARAGKTLEEMKQGIKLEKYQEWGQYKNFLPLNIEGVYRDISMHRRGNP